MIKNLKNVPFSFETTVLFFDNELNELSEYVFSIRKEDNYDYNESLLNKIKPYGTIKLFVALKAPNLKTERKISGILKVKISGSNITGIL